MSKQVNDSGRLAIAQVMHEALDSVANIGRNVVTTICGAVRKVYKGAEIPKDEQDAIVNELALRRGWSDAEARVRKSEARAILCTYAELPGAAAKLAAKGKGNWKDAVSLARKLRNGDSTTAAIAALTAEGTSKKRSPKAQAALLLKRVLKIKKLDAALLRGVQDLLDANHIK